MRKGKPRRLHKVAFESANVPSAVDKMAPKGSLPMKTADQMSAVEQQQQKVERAELNVNNSQFDQLNASQILRQHEDEHLWRKLYLQKSFYLVGTVLYLTFFIVVLVGVGVVDLSDPILITMLGTTVAHVVGVLAIAFHWLYPHHD